MLLKKLNELIKIKLMVNNEVNMALALCDT